MDTSKLYLADFPEEHKLKNIDIVSLYHERRFDELDSVVICKDRHGQIISFFGEHNWDCFPFSRRKDRNNLATNEFSNNPELQRELKLITFGWLFNINKKKKKAVTFSSVLSRLDKMKIAYRFLNDHNYTTLRELSKPSLWQAFEAYLTDQNYTQNTIQKVFVAINSAIHAESWHKLALGFSKQIRSNTESERLSKKEPQQTLAIPERLCDAIYGKAIALIEGAYPYCQQIVDTEKALQANYMEGRRIIDDKVKRGGKFTFINKDGSINSQKFATSIKGYTPQPSKEIIAPLAKLLPEIELSNAIDFQRYLSNLITASYIVCGGFSGMRDSELNKLTPHSYYKDSFEGRDYHMLQSHTFKLGEKRETWVTAASSKIAIELMSTLTEHWRNEVVYPDDKYTNTLWVNQKARSVPPVTITHWNLRLKNFCRQFGFIVTEADYQECLESNPRSLSLIEHFVKIGQPWPLCTHQFRRTLAFYCIKNRLGTLVALKQQFKHLYLAMTEWYTNGGKLASLRDLKVDGQIINLLNAINAETTANKIFQQWHSDETLSGTHGKAIMKMRGDVPTIYSSWEVIYKAVKDGKLTLHGSLHSYCKNGYECDMDGVVAPQFCVDCSAGGSIIDEQQAKWWQKKHRSLTAYMASGEDISVSERSHYITQIRAAELVMADFNIPFSAFEADLRTIAL
ncbi:hypothetical protein [Alishewanella sp. HL-SH06]|uniref:hypothetical protein n=1 Tax=Alishewanella sp. HL-SH06 TaxID=3461144 RepID=UPI0040419E08